MSMKVKTIAREEWTRITERRCAYMPFELGNTRGEAGLLWMDSVRAPFKTVSLGEEVVLADNAYSWLQLAPEREHFWVTVMFDASGKLLQFYFDISLENNVRAGGASSFVDLYLDIVLKPDGKMTLLDEDELESAYIAGDIDAKTRALALDTARRLMDDLRGKHARLCAECVKLREELIKRLAPA